MARQLKCEDCSYFWLDDYYDRKMCQYHDERWPAPCEEEDTELDSWEEYLDLDD